MRKAWSASGKLGLAPATPQRVESGAFPHAPGAESKPVPFTPKTKLDETHKPLTRLAVEIMAVAGLREGPKQP